MKDLTRSRNICRIDGTGLDCQENLWWIFRRKNHQNLKIFQEIWIRADIQPWSPENKIKKNLLIRIKIKVK